MSKIEDGGPAFPAGAVRKSRPAHDPGADFRVTDITDPKNGGMTLRQYAAIKLRVPNSGTDWLDEMILKSLRDEQARIQAAAEAAKQAEELAERLKREANTPQAGEIVTLIADHYRISNGAALDWLRGMFGDVRQAA